MKVFFSLALIYLLGSFSNAFADIPDEIPGHHEDVLLDCSTTANKRVLVMRDPKTDTFTILYGSDLVRPERTTVRQGNDMGTSRTLSTTESTEIREIYVSEPPEFVTVGVVDKGGVLSAYYSVQKDITKIVSDKCVPETIKSKFDFSENFQSLTEVD
jgi:hypothetical protein